MESSIGFRVKKNPIVPYNSRVDRTMLEKCPHCGGYLREKHDETKTERGRTFKIIHYRCIKCGKWSREEIDQ
jgi:DNA-directed RNA polymerase subunit RPC12/RpoP